jgi:hypothetical protein
MRRRWTGIVLAIRLIALALAAALTAAACSSDTPGQSQAEDAAPPTSASPTRTPEAPPETDVLAAERRTTWNPGLNAVGGIPERTKTCATLKPSGGDDTGAIQQALDGCQADQVVQLGAGEFRISGEGLTIGRSKVTLRGAGPDKTRLVKAEGSEFPVIIIGLRWAKTTHAVNLAADAKQGSKTAKLASDPGLRPGEIVTVDQVTNPKLTQWSERSPEGDPSRGWFGRPNRPIGQTMEVKSVDRNTVTFTTPFHIGFATKSQAQLTRISDTDGGEPVPAVRYSGIEDLYVAGGEGGDGGGNIHLYATAYSWVRNVESKASLGGSVVFSGTFRSVLRDSYLHSTKEPNPGGGGYGIVLNAYAADNLIENNISWNFNKVIAMRTTGGGNVIGYNYMEDGWGAGYPDMPEVGLNASHMTTPHHELFEGNQSWNFGGDSVWGNSIYITVFRNHLTGKRRSIKPLQLTDDSNRHVVGLCTGHWGYSFLGNVLGTADQDAAPYTRFVYQWPSSDDTIPMWKLGFNSEDPGGPQDTTVAEQTIRHGNFDHLRKNLDRDKTLDNKLPASLYLTDKPAFFGDRAWPWVTPENNGAVATLPARERFDAIHGH